jgi:hypothetical protein
MPWTLDDAQEGNKLLEENFTFIPPVERVLSNAEKSRADPRHTLVVQEGEPSCRYIITGSGKSQSIQSFNELGATSKYQV